MSNSENLNLAMSLLNQTTKNGKRNKNAILKDLYESGEFKNPIDRQKLIALVNIEVFKDKDIAIDLSKDEDIKKFMNEAITTKNSLDQSISNSKSNVSFNNWVVKQGYDLELVKSSDSKMIQIVSTK